jgi:hypothetical protein
MESIRNVVEETRSFFLVTLEMVGAVDRCWYMERVQDIERWCWKVEENIPTWMASQNLGVKDGNEKRAKQMK